MPAVDPAALLPVEALLKSALDVHVDPESCVDVSYRSRDEWTSDWDTARRRMRSVARYAATVELGTALPSKPEDPYHHCVDLNGNEPGIVVRTRPRFAVARMSNGRDGVRQTTTVDQDAIVEGGGGGGEDVVLPPPPDVEYDAAVRRAKSQDDRATKTLVRKATRARQKDVDTMENVRAKEERKMTIAAETKEEKAARREAEKQAATEKKRAREEAAAEKKRLRAEKEEMRAGNEPRDGTDDVAEHVPDQTATPAPDLPAKPARAHTSERDAGQVLPMRMCTTKPKTTYYGNPTTHARCMRATSSADLPDRLRRAVLGRGADPDLVLVKGPPGTGKTHWICEHVREVLLQSDGGGGILVCAPTNVTVAGLYRRLLDLPDLRHRASLCLCPTRIPVGTPVMSQDPNREIVCATIAGRNGPLLLDRSFSCVVVDEAAQCSEALLWTLFRADVSHLALVGDTAQLPCVAVDDEASSHGHTVSAMERLLEGGYSNAVSLTTQRRMNSRISAFPNRLFYNGTLVDHPDASDRTYKGMPPLVAAKVPTGTDVRVGTSYENETEAMLLCEVLLRDVLGKHEASPSDVVIVAPYAAQCRCVLSLLDDVPSARGVHVHTVDSFQGREAEVVLLSICRTGNHCGFWSDGRRLNVACTRAKSSLYVFGSFDWSRGCLADLAAEVRGGGGGERWETV